MPGYTEAELAVDGRYTDMLFDGGQCAASDWGQTTAEWRVDLEGVKYIHHMLIQHVTGNRVWGIVLLNLFILFTLTKCIIYTTITEFK